MDEVPYRPLQWTLLSAAALTVGVGAAFVPLQIDSYDGPAGHAADTAVGEGWWFSGLHIGILTVMILGVLVASTEYTTGTIRATLAAIPARHRALAAKVTTLVAVTLITGAVQAVAVFLIARPILSSDGIDISLTDPEAWGGAAMATLAMIAAGLFGLSAGLLIRHTAGAIGAVVAVTWVVSGLGLLLPDRWSGVVKALPTNALEAMFTPGGASHHASGPGAAIFLGYVTVTLSIAGVLFARRDA